MLTNSAHLEGELEEEGSREPIPKVGGNAVQDPAWMAGFVSISDSYKAVLASVVEDWI